ncbi:MAG: hypothetical protein H0V71_12580, partial [Chloroflexi bacterium]|nr:hypothetical protein [Chloroflexota bacterium]
MRGRAHVFGDDISTDQIIPGKYLKLSEAEASKHVMEGADPTFIERNFGSGSSRDFAAIALKAAGVSCVIAPFFARIFFRNAINQGLAVLECREAGRIRGGDEIKVDVIAGEVRDLTQGFTLTATKLPPIARPPLTRYCQPVRGPPARTVALRRHERATSCISSVPLARHPARSPARALRLRTRPARHWTRRT